MRRKSVVSSCSLHPRDMRKTSSTFLVPDYLLPALHKKISAYGSLSAYFGFLLRKYYLPGDFAAYGVKRRYQIVGLNLHRKNFRPLNADWLFLTDMARGLNVSRCSLFVYLLQVDLSEMAGSKVVRNRSIVGTPHRKKRSKTRIPLLRFLSLCHVAHYLRELRLWR